MIDFIIAILLTPITMVCLLIIGILFDHNEVRGLSGFLLLIVLVTAYFVFEPSMFTIGILAATWIPVGVLWSWRCFTVQCRNATRRYEEKDISYSTALCLVDFKSNRPRIVYWAYAWPLSMVQSSLEGFINLIQRALSDLAIKLFSRTSEKSRNILEEIKDRSERK